MAELRPMGEMKKATRNDLKASTSTVTMNIISSVNDIQIKTHLKELLADRGMSQQELSELTGFGKNIISAFYNNNFTNFKVGYAHIYAIMIALRLTDLSEFLYVDMPDSIKEEFKKDSDTWKETKTPPTSVQSLQKQAEKLRQ